MFETRRRCNGLRAKIYDLYLEISFYEKALRENAEWKTKALEGWEKDAPYREGTYRNDSEFLEKAHRHNLSMQLKWKHEFDKYYGSEITREQNYQLEKIKDSVRIHDLLAHAPTP